MAKFMKEGCGVTPGVLKKKCSINKLHRLGVAILVFFFDLTGQPVHSLQMSCYIAQL